MDSLGCGGEAVGAEEVFFSQVPGDALPPVRPSAIVRATDRHHVDIAVVEAVDETVSLREPPRPEAAEAVSSNS